MIDKISASVAEALADVSDGATVMIGGFGTAGIPNALIIFFLINLFGLSCDINGKHKQYENKKQTQSPGHRRTKRANQNTDKRACRSGSDRRQSGAESCGQKYD